MTWWTFYKRQLMMAKFCVRHGSIRFDATQQANDRLTCELTVIHSQVDDVIGK
jgi:hypothetical protein